MTAGRRVTELTEWPGPLFICLRSSLFQEKSRSGGVGRSPSGP
uniref:Uncharacterized protein n=1 Tax=Anguilla anguilla TaxID=7936 RepID=A0A0E9VFX3_ANGAN